MDHSGGITLDIQFAAPLLAACALHAPVTAPRSLPCPSSCPEGFFPVLLAADPAPQALRIVDLEPQIPQSAFRNVLREGWGNWFTNLCIADCGFRIVDLEPQIPQSAFRIPQCSPGRVG